MNKFTLQLDGKRIPLQHYWELCVGSCHASTALRADYQGQLTRCQRELGFRYVRFHGLFDDDMSVVIKSMFTGQLSLSFTNIDKIFDFLLSINMKPFVELGFMPEAYASGDSTVFHYKGNTSPPADYDQWADFIAKFVEHLISRYGRDEVRQWYFEVWNEPNLGGEDSPFGFWSSTKEEYFKLYKVTANAVKSVDASLPVGGPSTSNNAWLTDFIDYCKDNSVPVDFITTHHYPTDVVLGYGEEDSVNFPNPIDFSKPDEMKAIMQDEEKRAKLLQEFSVFQSHLWENVDRGVLTEMAKKARQEVGELPLHYTEWGSLAGLPSDGPFGASFLTKTILDNHGIVDGYSFWTFSDIFEEGGQPSAAFHGGFGLMTFHGIPKASYRTFQLLHALGSEVYTERFAKGTLDAYAIAKPEANAVQLLLVNHHSLLHTIQEETLNITLQSAKKVLSADICRVDEDNANALAAWQKMDSPEYLTAGQVDTLKGASEVLRKEQKFTQANTELTLEVVLPAMGTALVTIYFESL